MPKQQSIESTRQSCPHDWELEYEWENYDECPIYHHSQPVAARGGVYKCRNNCGAKGWAAPAGSAVRMWNER